MIGMMNEHITAPIISGILKHAYCKHEHREHTVTCPFINHLIIKDINRVYVRWKKTLFIKAVVSGLALLTAGDDGEEASRGEVGDTLMNQVRIQFRVAHKPAQQRIFLDTYSTYAHKIQFDWFWISTYLSRSNGFKTLASLHIHSILFKCGV